MRKLATIRTISDIRPIPEADAIEVAIVDGWECVIAKKDGFKIGDLVVYVEIDSIVPERPEFEFLRPRKFRVRTIKLRGQVSQGLVLPLHVLDDDIMWTAKEGNDVTNELGIKKYDPEAEAEKKNTENTKKKMHPFVKFLFKFAWFRKIYYHFNPKISGSFPDFISKTDEERVQNLSRKYTEWREKGIKFEGREKIDGQSGTWFLKKLKNGKWDFGVCSRNFRLFTKDNNYWKIAEKYNIESILKTLVSDYYVMFNPEKTIHFIDNIVLQGEIYGTGIQGNKYKVDGLRLANFNLKVNGNHVVSKEAEILLGQYGIIYAPLVVEDYTLPENISDIVEFSKGNSAFLKRKREGLVFRNYEHNISFKVINPSFLLAEED